LVIRYRLDDNGVKLYYKLSNVVLKLLMLLSSKKKKKTKLISGITIFFTAIGKRLMISQRPAAGLIAQQKLVTARVVVNGHWIHRPRAVRFLGRKDATQQPAALTSLRLTHFTPLSRHIRIWYKGYIALDVCTRIC
jgi:hypothetical protein